MSEFTDADRRHRCHRRAHATFPSQRPERPHRAANPCRSNLPHPPPATGKTFKPTDAPTNTGIIGVGKATANFVSVGGTANKEVGERPLPPRLGLHRRPLPPATPLTRQRRPPPSPTRARPRRRAPTPPQSTLSPPPTSLTKSYYSAARRRHSHRRLHHVARPSCVRAEPQRRRREPLPRRQAARCRYGWTSTYPRATCRPCPITHLHWRSPQRHSREGRPRQRRRRHPIRSHRPPRRHFRY